jgi:RNA polymerase sigma factor for flagellar operon FliA
VDSENLESAGVLGLIESASQYDPGRNVEFRTFSYQRIRGAILDELRRNCPLSQQLLQKIATLRQARSRFDRTASVEDLACAAEMSVPEVTQCLQAARLTRPETWNDSVRVRGHIGDNGEPTSLEQEEMQQVLADGIESLPEKMRIAVALHYNEGLKLKEVGEVLGLSESRVSRILDAARSRLQEFASQCGY